MLKSSAPEMPGALFLCPNGGMKMLKEIETCIMRRGPTSNENRVINRRYGAAKRKKVMQIALLR